MKKTLSILIIIILILNGILLFAGDDDENSKINGDDILVNTLIKWK